MDLSSLECCIHRLTGMVRQNSGREFAREIRSKGWWVMACGERFGSAPIELRDSARERLRKIVERKGILLAEHLWVWDETDRAQLVLATLPTEVRAEKVAETLRMKGLEVRVKRESD